jgi:threonine dehydrogenase-like Zn-dependent dehydrogenase
LILEEAGLKTLYFDKDVPRALAVKALRGIWPGVVWSPLAPFRAADLEEPELPGSRWLRVRNKQCGICATDLSLLRVDADPRVALAAEPGLQRIYLGHEAVGEVIEVGGDVARFKPGDTVVIEARPIGSPNCHTQEIEPICRQCAAGQARFCENASLGRGPNAIGAGWSERYVAHESEVWPVPDGISIDQASLIEPMAVGVHAVLRAQPAVGEKVLVVGAGTIGLLTLQAARALAPEADITVLARYDHQAQAARSMGATRIISGAKPYAALAKVTGARHYQAPLNRGMLLGGFDVIYDCVGSATTITDSLRWARARGKVVMVGSSFAPMHVDLSPVYYQEVDLIGSLTFGLDDWQGERVHTFDIVIQLLLEGALSDAGMITHRYPFSAYREAIRTAEDKRQRSIKVTLVFPQGEA